MIYLYSIGAFPMDFSDGLNWYLPTKRCVIFADNFNYPRSLKQFIKKNKFEIKFDFNTLNIIKNCAARERTWISKELIQAYKGLIEREFIHSVAVIKENEIIGGLYGLSIKGVFIGESMFNKIPQASKVALINLLFRLKDRKYKICDVQFMTPLLKQFGAVEISLEKYKDLLFESYKFDTKFV
ncbi:MAG: leucyl/phenylalanyl-tRNA--protein transferase [Ignavibacteriales bacterium]|nr:leucyl/phenylalanyl-tRNA--protein transferase [Ignavibacteriales bacterium]